MDRHFPIPVIGLTGGIASGKTQVARIFSEKLGVPVIDADQLSRQLSAPGGRAAPAIEKRFGTLDRGRIREIIFSDSQARADLEAILHPLIREESKKQVEAQAEKGATLVIYEAALLVETGRHADFDALIVVEAPQEKRVARVMSRDQVSREQALSIIHAQASDEARRSVATHLIQNTGSLSELETAARRVLVAIRENLAKS